MSDLLHDLHEEKMMLEEKIHTYETEVQTMESNGVYNGAKYFEMKSELSSAQNKLTQIEHRISTLANERTEAVEEAGSNLDMIEVDGIQLELKQLCAGDDAYLILSGYFKSYVATLTEKHVAIKQSLENEISHLSETVSELLEEATQLSNYEKEVMQLKQEVKDIESKRDAAVKQLEDAKHDIERLNADNKQLRDQLSAKAVTSVHTTEDFKEALKRLEMKKPAIYDLRFVDEIKRNRYQAKLAETDDIIEFSTLQLGGYRVLEGEELNRFRQDKAEREAKEAAKVPELPAIDKEVIPFNEGNETLYTVDYNEDTEHTVCGEVASTAEEVTRAEFEALKEQVQALNMRVFG